jgi:hypothetical protein
MTGLAVLALFLLGFAPVFAGSGRAQTEAVALTAQEDESPQETGEAPAETIRPGPQNLKEKWGIGVFLVWLWLSIAVLVSFIRLQIREADRVTGLGYDDPIKVRRDERAP